MWNNPILFHHKFLFICMSEPIYDMHLMTWTFANCADTDHKYKCIHSLKCEKFMQKINPVGAQDSSTKFITHHMHQWKFSKLEAQSGEKLALNKVAGHYPH